MKTYISIYCLISSIILCIPPIYRQLPGGFIIRDSFPNNYCFIFNICGSRMIQIDWSLLSIELLLLVFFLGYVYLENIQDKNNDV